MATHLRIRPYFDGTNSYRIVDTDFLKPINYYVNSIILPNSYEKDKSIISFSSRLQDKRCVVSNGLVSVMADKDVKVLLLDNGILAFYTEKDIVFTLDMITFKKYSLPKDLQGNIVKVTESTILLDCGKINFTLEFCFTESVLPFKFKIDAIKLDNF